jgi:UMF1 family MFS transporter
MTLNKRHFLGWCLFDFAGSLLMINGGLYFPQWVVIDNHVPDFWYNGTTICVSVLLIASSAFIGSLGDRNARDIQFLVWTSIAMFMSTAALHFISLLGSLHLRGVLGLSAFGVLLYNYQIGIVFYNGMLADVGTGQEFARKSATGLAAGWLGGIVGIVTVYPFVAGVWHIPNVMGRSAAFLPTSLIYGGLAVISLILLRDYKRADSSLREETYKPRKRSGFLVELSSVARNPFLALFLVTFFLYGDAVLTIENNITIFLENVWHFSDQTKAILFLSLLIMAGVGGFASAEIARRLGLPKTLLFILYAWVALLIVICLTTNEAAFLGLFLIMGVLYGAVWNISRVFFLTLLPIRERGKYFGIYSAFERFSSIVGPLLWSVPIVLFPAGSSTGYRCSMAAMAVIIAAAAIIFRRAIQREYE